MDVDDLVHEAYGGSHRRDLPIGARRRRQTYVVLIDTKDGEPPRRVESVEWDDDHSALLISPE